MSKGRMAGQYMARVGSMPGGYVGKKILVLMVSRLNIEIHLIQNFMTKIALTLIHMRIPIPFMITPMGK